MSEKIVLSTPYFMEADGSIRSGHNDLVCEVFDGDDVEIERMLSALNRYNWLAAENAKLQAKLKTAMDYINDLADNGFEKARAVRDEISGVK